jgi:hypothetical protein
MRTLAIVVCLLLSAASAHAEMNVKDFFAKYDRADASDKQFMETVLGQVGNGLSWANSRLGFLKRQKLFCQPGDLALTDVQTVQLLRQHTRTNPKLEQAPFGLGLLVSFEEEYPCRQ